MPLSNPLRDMTPDVSSFETEWLAPVEVDGISLRAFRITTALLDDGPVRTYGVVGTPSGPGPYPAILHIHGGGGAADPASVAYYIKRGYAAMSFDWNGPNQRSPDEPHTTYPPSAMTDADPFGFVSDGVLRSRFFLGARAARCCLSLLSSLDTVESAHMAIYGISWGGFMTWMVNGSDPRVRCATAIYGTGGLYGERKWNGDFNAASEAGRTAWMRFVEPRSYIPFQHGALLHINGANDFFGRIDLAAEMLPALPVDWRCDYTPNANHAFDSTSTALMDAWHDFHLKAGPAIPLAPPLKAVAAGESTVRVTSAGPSKNLTLWYSCGPAEFPFRCWKPTRKWKANSDGTLTIDLPVTGHTWLFVRETHPKRGFTISSAPLVLSMPHAKGRPQKTVFSSKRRDGWGHQMTIDPQHAASLHEFVTIDHTGLAVNPSREGLSSEGLGRLVFFGLSDPDNRPGQKVRALEIELSGAANLNILAHVHISDIYTAKLESPSDGCHLVPLESFRQGDKSLADFTRLTYMVLTGQARPGESVRIKRLSWK